MAVQINMAPAGQELRDIRSPLTRRELQGKSDPAKQQIRNLVGEHFLSWHLPREPLRLFSLPGLFWTFERQLLAVHPGPVSFVAVERSHSILDAGLLYMPGRRRWSVQLQLNSGQLHGVQSEQAVILNASLSTVLTTDRRDKRVSDGHDRPSGSADKRWAKLLKGWTCCWFDFCCPITDDVLTIVARAGVYCSRWKPIVPVAISVMRCRDPDVAESLESRLEALAAGFAQSPYRRFEQTAVHVYTSAGGTAMLTVLGLLHPSIRS